MITVLPFTRDMPCLWNRVHAFMESVMTYFAPERFAHRWFVSRTERKELRSYLKPTEILARRLLYISALTWLLMTEAGRQLRRTTQKIMPQRPGPAGVLKHPYRIPHPAWRTIWHPPSPSPPPAAESKPESEDDPRTWRCSFRTVGWAWPADESVPPQKKPSTKVRPSVISLGDDRFASEYIAHRQPKPEPKPAEPEGRAIARRIEALRRVLENPAPAIRRIAAWLAAVPRGILEPRPAYAYKLRKFHLGEREILAAAAFEAQAVRAFEASG